MAGNRAVSLVVTYMNADKSPQVMEFPGAPISGGGPGINPSASGINNLNAALKTYDIQQVEQLGANSGDGSCILLFHLVER